MGRIGILAAALSSALGGIAAGATRFAVAGIAIAASTPRAASPGESAA
jgi:hypothetical protein